MTEPAASTTSAAFTAPGRPFRIVVVGGGIAGLAAAHRLLELGPPQGIPVDLTLIEARSRLGGIIATERDRGYLIEVGPDGFLTEKPWALDLCGRLGLTDRLIGTRPVHRRAFIVHGGRLHPLPDGFALLAPTRFGPVFRSSLFSWRGKMRMAMDLVLPRRPADRDESLAQFVARRLGREALERAAQPMVAGIYTADPETLSLAATMPRFLEMERRYGSVIRGLRHARARQAEEVNRTAGGRKRAGGGDAGESGPRWSLFATPSDGMGMLVEALERVVRTGRGVPVPTIRNGRRAISLGSAEMPRPSGGQGSGRPADRATGLYHLGLDDGTSLEADGVIMATEAHQAARLVSGLDPELAGALGAIPYASSATVTFGYRREQIAHPLDGYGCVVPRVEGRPLLACTFSSVKFTGRAPEGTALLRTFWGGALEPGVLDLDDTALAALAGREIGDLLGIAGAPRLVRVHRHPLAMPQYLIGHLDRVAAIEARAARHPGLALAGSAYCGVGVPDCIRSGEAAAENVLAAVRVAAG